MLKKEKAVNTRLFITNVIKWGSIKYLNYCTIHLSKFGTKKWIEVNDFSCGQHSFNKSIKFKTPIPRSDMCDYSNAYIIVKGTIIVEGINGTDQTEC